MLALNWVDMVQFNFRVLICYFTFLMYTSHSEVDSTDTEEELPLRRYKHPQTERSAFPELPHSLRLGSDTPEFQQYRPFPKSHFLQLGVGTSEFQQYIPLPKTHSLRLESSKTEFRFLPKPHFPPPEGGASPKFQQYRSLDKAHSHHTQDLAHRSGPSRPEQPGLSSFEPNYMNGTCPELAKRTKTH